MRNLFQTVALDLVDQALMTQTKKLRGFAAVTFRFTEGFPNHLNLKCGHAILK